MSETTASASPIADLSYRGYDGPLENRALRWWTVALAMIRIARRKPLFWVWSILSSLSYLFMILMIFLQTMMGQVAPAEQSQRNYAQWFVQALPGSILWLLAVAMVVGAGSIAADNRSNALLVYLSKPLTKADYLIGKWVGLFVLLFTVAFLPALVLYLYLLLTYRAEGFLTQDPYLLGKVVLVTAIPAVLHSSLILGFSAWSKSPLMAGALYGAFYFLGVILAPIVSFITSRGELMSRTAVTVRSMAIPGLIEGFSYYIYDEGMVPMFGGRRFPGVPEIPRPYLWPMILAAVLLVVLSIIAARARIRAVEVVRG